MNNLGIPRGVEEFILRNIHSVEQLEILLLLARDANREWSIDEINAVVKTAISSIESRLIDLQARKLISKRHDAAQSVYRYKLTSNMKGEISELAKFYESHKNRIIELIYSRPAEAIRIFADALRFWRDDD